MSKRLLGREEEQQQPQQPQQQQGKKDQPALGGGGVVDQSTNLVAGVFETVDELRKRVSSQRSTEALEEMVRLGKRLSRVEADKRLEEIRIQLKFCRNKEERLQDAISQLAREVASARDKPKKEALSIAKQRVEEKLNNVRAQESLYERQRKLVLVASGKASEDSLLTTSGTSRFMQFFQSDERGSTGKSSDELQQKRKMELEEALEESTTNLVAGVFESVDELRNRVRATRTTELLEEMVRSGTKMSPQEEERRLGELNNQLSVSRKKQERLQNALKELTKEEASAREKSRKDALSVAKQRVEEKIARSREQFEVYERQKQLVLLAAGKAPKKSRQPTSSGFSSVMQFFRKTNETNSTSVQKSENQKPQKVPTVLKTPAPSKSKNETKIDDSAAPTSSDNMNPLGGVQKFMASLLDFGRKEEWVVAFPKSRIDPGEVKPIRVAGLDLLVVATRDGKRIYCIANSCSHLGTPLETGMMERRKTDRPTEDGCEDCIVCPLHKTAFALETGEVNGEWCPYPPLLGAMMGAVKTKSSVAVFDIRTRGKNIEIKLNSRLDDENKAKQRDSEIKEGA